MARRKKSSPAEDLVELVALMPWWAGCVLALVSYLWLHGVATHEVVALIAPGQVGTVVTQTVWKSLATVGQYLLPLLCLMGAATSAYGRSKRKSLVSNVVSSASANALNNMSWQEFELLVGEGFRQQGYQVIENGGGGADGGGAVPGLRHRHSGPGGAEEAGGREDRHGQRHGRQRRRWRFCSDIRALHRRCQSLCQRAHRANQSRHTKVNRHAYSTSDNPCFDLHSHGCAARLCAKAPTCVQNRLQVSGGRKDGLLRRAMSGRTRMRRRRHSRT